MYFGSIEPINLLAKHLFMSLILCLETSSKACSVALSEEGKCIAYVEAKGEMMHSKVITLLIQKLLDENGKNIADLSAVAVSQGPGSYTGLRVGASCAKGICYAQGLPLISVPTLEIIASELLDSDLPESALIIPMIDARRQEVYYNIYDQALQSKQETTNLVLDGLSFDSLSSSHLVFCGDGAFKMEAHLKARKGWRISSTYAKASEMALIAYDKLRANDTEDVAYYVPFYLKPPNITKSTKSLF